MAAVWMRVGAELRDRWRSSLALAILIGVAGGFVLTSVAGARRTGSAYERFRSAYPGADVFLPNPAFGPEFGAAVHDPAEIRRMPQVAAMSAGRAATSQWGASFAAADEAFGFEMPRWKILEGRPYDPARIDEAVAFEAFATGEGLEVGDTLRYPGTPPPDGPPQCAKVGEGPQIEMKIVGIAVGAGQFIGPVSEEPWSLALTPAMYRRLPELAEQTGCEFIAFPPTPGMMWIKTHPGQTDDLVQELQQRAGDSFVISEPQSSYDVRNGDSMALQGRALWLLAGAAAIATLLVVSQALARDVRLGAEEQPVLRAIGLTPGQLGTVSMIRVGLMAATGATLAVVIAYLLSPLTPLGTARLAEPSPGFAIDAAALGLGAAGLVALTALLGTVPSWVAARTRADGPPAKPSSAAVAAGRAGLPAPAVTGIRFALETGRGRTAVPVRTTIAVIALGLGMLAATMTFSASADHLLETPSAYGLTVDVWIHNDPDAYPFQEHVEAVRANPDVIAAAFGSPGGAIQIEGRSVQMVDFEPIKGGAQPRVFDGRYPAEPGELLLGSRTASTLGKGVGDRVRVLGSSDDPDAPPLETTFTVVGIGEIPPIERSGLGEGAIVTVRGAAALFPGSPVGAGGLFVKVRPGADLERTVAELKAAMGNEELQHFGFPPPSDVVDFGRVRSLPALLAGLMGLIAAVTLAHVLVTSVRRRRRDVAILKTIGFVRGQARLAVAWHATTTTLVAAAIGVPLGILGGRWLWSIFVRRIGLDPAPVMPVLVLAMIGPVALLLANAIAAIPARSAARTHPAVVLRTE